MTAGDRLINLKHQRILSQASQNAIFYNDLGKRVFDITVSGFLIVLFAPLFALLAIIIKRDSPGPIFYRGLRIGRYGRPFRILKFRTMKYTPKGDDGPRITAHDDSRITTVGKWLRDTKLNEFPQFWNVLIGDMSLVGPRPEDPAFERTWPRGISKEVLSVRPGITSPSSVRYHDEEKLLSGCDVEQMYLSELSPNKVRLDQLYVRYRSYSLDLDTLIWTALTFIPRVKSYKLPDELLYLGLFSRAISRFFNWFTIDLLTTFTAFGITGLFFRLKAPLNLGQTFAVLLALTYAVLFSGMGVIFGTNRIRWSKANPTDLFDLLPAWILATVVAFLTNLFIGDLSADFILIGSIFSLFGFISTRSRNFFLQHFLERSIFFQKKNELIKERVLIIGLGASAQHTAWLFEHLLNSRSFHIVGFVDNDLTKQGSRYFGSNVIGKWEDIPSLVKKHDIGLIVLSDYRVNAESIHQIKEICLPTGAKLVIMPDILASINHLVKSPFSKSEDSNVMHDKPDLKCIDCLAQHVSIFNSRND